MLKTKKTHTFNQLQIKLYTRQSLLKNTNRTRLYNIIIDAVPNINNPASKEILHNVTTASRFNKL